MEDKSKIKLLICAAVMVLASACSSRIPPAINDPDVGDVEVSQVLSSPDAFYSSKIRWGGVLVSVENTANQSKLTIVSFPTNHEGRPIVSADSPGRFIALVDGFLEPLVYRENREITVVGRVGRPESGKVGDFEYDFPVVNVEDFYLWPKRVKRDVYPEPYYRPYIYPHYPFYPWPYYRFPYHNHNLIPY
jgi:outer membrane lipoprotein